MAEKILAWLDSDHRMTDERKVVILFGLDQMIMLSAAVVLFFMVGLLTDLIKETIILMAAFIPVRVYAGGYHAATRGRCLVFSTGLFAAGLYVFCNTDPFGGILWMEVLILSLVMWKTAPVENENKRLTQKEKSRYKKKLGHILIAEFVISLLCFSAGNNLAVKGMFAGICMTVTLQLLGIFNLKVKRKKVQIQ